MFDKLLRIAFAVAALALSAAALEFCHTRASARYTLEQDGSIFDATTGDQYFLVPAERKADISPVPDCNAKNLSVDQILECAKLSLDKTVTPHDAYVLHVNLITGKIETNPVNPNAASVPHRR
jgi:hypothetical protein